MLCKVQKKSDLGSKSLKTTSSKTTLKVITTTITRLQNSR